MRLRWLAKLSRNQCSNFQNGTFDIQCTLRPTPPAPPPAKQFRRFHGSVRVDSSRVGRDAGRIAEEVISHLAGQMGAEVIVTIEIEAKLPSGVTDQLVRTITENSRTLKFDSQGFETE
jgi:hypothetical protein